MSFIDSLLAKRQRSGHGVTKSMVKGGLKFGGAAFVPGECPHKQTAYTDVFKRASADFKGEHHELSDFRSRRAVMDVSPRDEVGWEKSHAHGVCLTAQRSLGAGTDLTRAMLGRLFGGTGRPADGHIVQVSRKHKRLPTTQQRLMQDAATHMANGLCAALTKKETICQRKALPGTYRCNVHTGASTTSGA